MLKKDLEALMDEIREEAKRHENCVQPARYRNNENDAQYESGVAVGLRKAIMIIYRKTGV